MFSAMLPHLVLLLPLLVAGKNTCVETSPSPTFLWTLTLGYGSYVEYSSPSHLAIAWTHVGFDLANPATAQARHCHAQSPYAYNPFRGGTELINCNPAHGDSLYTDIKFRLSVNLQFPTDPNATYFLDLNQTWVCIEGDVKTP